MEKNKDLFTDVAKWLDEDIQQEIREHENREIEIPEELNQKFLEMVRTFDTARKKEKKKEKYRRIERMVACVLVCVISVGTITMGTSEAFRKRVFDVFSNENNGSITLINNDERQMIGSWENYWYPTYLPKDFVLIAAEETDYFLLYKNSVNDNEIRICELESDAAISVDTDTTNNEKIKFGPHEGYLFSNMEKDSYYAILLTDVTTIKITFKGVGKKEALKVIDNLEYIEKS